MRINWKLVNYDMLEDIQLPQCPTMFRSTAEHIIQIIAEMEPFSYSKMSQFDKHLVITYWKYDGLDKALQEPDSFRQWYITQATDPTLICRARRWLVEHNYLVPPSGVTDRAQESSEKWRARVGGKGQWGLVLL